MIKLLSPLLSISLWILMSLAFNVVSAQETDNERSFKILRNSLLLRDGKWVAENPVFNVSDHTSPKWFLYEYTVGTQPASLKLHIQGILPGKEKWISYRKLLFTWDADNQTVLCTGTDSSGNIYTGEAGNITASIFSFDLLDPLIKSSPSFLRYNLVLTGNSMSIQHFRQQGDKWLFVEKLDFLPFKK